MARYDDSSPYVERWTNAKLMREARRVANFEGFGASMIGRNAVTLADSDKATAFIVEETRIYRDSWLNPVFDEIERRFVKAKKG